MRLNGWQRIGIAASIVWALGAPIYMDSAALRDADERWGWVYDSCRDVASNDPEQCLQRASGNGHAAVSPVSWAFVFV
jgi:hypothetical protein